MVGKGSQETKLREMASSNITFKQNISKDELALLYSNCKGFIFPQYEDYGLTPLEANAAGRPVIAYGKGGVLDTMISYQRDPTNATAYFFEEQNTKRLNDAIDKFEKITFAPEIARKNAEKFSEERFRLEFRNFVDSIM